ncbi:MAG: 50S ribosomal protein L25 [Phycisphaerae bacterium]
MDVPTLQAETRTKLGTKHTRKLRAQGRLPGIIYGHGEAPETFSVSAHDVAMEMEHGARLVELNLGGKANQYLIKEIQYDHLGKDPIHMDLARVDLHERIRVRVVVELRGTPKGIHEGGILDQLLDNIEIECLASEIPQTLHPNVVELDVGDNLLVRDLELPEGVVAISDPEEKIAMVHLLSVAAEAEVKEEEEEASDEPERIGRVAESDEGKETGK